MWKEVRLDGTFTLGKSAIVECTLEAVEETLVNARSSGEHEPEELRMKREMLEAMTLPVVRVYTAYELVPGELDTVKQVAEKLRGKVIFTLHRIATYATAKLLLDVGLDPSSPPALAGYASAKEKDLAKGYPYKGDIADAGINGAVLVGGVAAFVVDMKFQESLQEKVKSEIEDPFAGPM